MTHGKYQVRYVAMLIVSGLLAGCGENVPAPKSFKKYTAKDAAFSCEYPAGWEVAQGARSDNMYSWAKFTKGDVLIRVDADATGSIMGDIQKNVGRDEHPVVALHERYKRNMEENYDGFKDGKAKTIESPLGDCQVSQFTADGGSTKGIRATMLAHDRRIAVVCTCAPGEWKTLSPAFNKVITSMSR